MCTNDIDPKTHPDTNPKENGCDVDEYDQFNSTLPEVDISQIVACSDTCSDSEESQVSQVDQELADMFAGFCNRLSQSQSVDGVSAMEDPSPVDQSSSAVQEHEDADKVTDIDDIEEMQISNSPELGVLVDDIDDIESSLLAEPVSELLSHNPSCDDAIETRTEPLAETPLADNVMEEQMSSQPLIQVQLPDIPDIEKSMSIPERLDLSLEEAKLDIGLDKELDQLLALDFSRQGFDQGEGDDARPKIRLEISESFDSIAEDCIPTRQIPQWDGADDLPRKRSKSSSTQPKKKRKTNDLVLNTYLEHDVLFERCMDVGKGDWKFKVGEMWSPVKGQQRVYSPPQIDSPTYTQPVVQMEDLMVGTGTPNSNMTPNFVQTVQTVQTVTPKSVKFLPSSSLESPIVSKDKDQGLLKEPDSKSSDPVMLTPTPLPKNIKITPSPIKKDCLDTVEYREPFYSNEGDIPSKPFVFANRVFKFKKEPKKYFRNAKNGNLIVPVDITKSNQEKKRMASQVLKPTQKNTQGFTWTQSQSHEDESKIPFVSLSMELFSDCSDAMEPNPARDAIFFIAYTIEGKEMAKSSGIYMVQDRIGFVPFSSYQGIEIHVNPTEKEMIQEFMKMVKSIDPDLLVGYEVHNRSWGYLHERSQVYSMNMCQMVSKLLPKFCQNNGFYRDKDTTNAGEEFFAKKASGLSSTGRIFLNVWRIMRKTLGTTSYTIENAVFHICHQRIPLFKNSVVKEWYFKSPLFRWRVFRYVLERTKWNLALLDATDTIHQTWEFAQVYGMDFFSVLTRGSQFRVESILLRIAQPENFVMFSPSRDQVQQMDAPECLPLNMEPDSRLYPNPVAVLDFQSLYPSLMVAYNYCYSTCIGKLDHMNSTGYTIGCKPMYQISSEEFEQIKDHVNIAPNGVVFVKPHIRKGLLGKMVSELLETRVMIKQSMKLHKNSRSISRLLDAQQLGIKLLANVTFGYTAASFSGRMPCVDISDAIIQSGRITLERGIDLIHSNPFWNARVVYGDTDSLFVSMPGISKQEAFAVGTEIVNRISESSPLPIKLKFEKVYLPCILLAKKRYVGFMYETIENIEPVFDAKGIETVRRDGCPAIAKIMENCLKIIFRTRDLSLMKEYLRTEWSNILRGNVIIQDFLIAKEVKMGTYRAKTLPPGAHISKKRMEKDDRTEPEYGDRVPFVVVHRGPSHRLIDAVVTPHELINDNSLRLHGMYYITKQIIPPLCRMFNLIGADIEYWFHTMPKSFLVTEYPEESDEKSKRTIDGYYRASHCIVCKAPTQEKLCEECVDNVPLALNQLGHIVKQNEEKFKILQELCRSCTGNNTNLDGDVPCTSLDCSLYYQRMKAQQKIRLVPMLETIMDQLEQNEHTNRTNDLLESFM